MTAPEFVPPPPELKKVIHTGMSLYVACPHCTVAKHRMGYDPKRIEIVCTGCGERFIAIRNEKPYGFNFRRR